MDTVDKIVLAAATIGGLTIGLTLVWIVEKCYQWLRSRADKGNEQVIKE